MKWASWANGTRVFLAGLLSHCRPQEMSSYSVSPNMPAARRLGLIGRRQVRLRDSLSRLFGALGCSNCGVVAVLADQQLRGAENVGVVDR
jgi:hypothetical protein